MVLVYLFSEHPRAEIPPLTHRSIFNFYYKHKTTPISSQLIPQAGIEPVISAGNKSKHIHQASTIYM